MVMVVLVVWVAVGVVVVAVRLVVVVVVLVLLVVMVVVLVVMGGMWWVEGCGVGRLWWSCFRFEQLYESPRRKPG